MTHIWKHHIPTSALHIGSGLILLVILFGDVKAEVLGGPLQQGVDVEGVEASSTLGKGVAPSAKIKLFDRADVDHNRKLSFSEFASVKRLQHVDSDKRRKLFAFLDQDKDGFLQMGELHPHVPKELKITRRLFTRLDRNGDERLTSDEFFELSKLSKTNKINPKVLFDRLDQNNSGFIERAELHAKLSKYAQANINFMAYDQNANGSLNYGEYSMMAMVCKWSEQRRRALFEKVDSNRNGELSELELSEMSLSRQRGRSHMAPRSGERELRPE